MIDASKVIWILASNALDPVIVNVLKNHNLEGIIDSSSLTLHLHSRLSSELQGKFGVREMPNQSGELLLMSSSFHSLAG